MLLGSFVESIDAINDSTEDLIPEQGQHDSESISATSANLMPPYSVPMPPAKENRLQTASTLTAPVRRPSTHTARRSRLSQIFDR
jgi:hypothetical protein